MDGKAVLVDYEHFMERFVPLPPGPVGPRKTRYSAVRLQDIPLKPESAMYPDLMEKLNVSWLAPGYSFVETPSKPDKNASKLRVDGGMYPAADAPEENKNTDWSTIEVFIECKTDDTKGDPFDDSAVDGSAYADERRGVLGQMLTYSYSMLKAQHRTHLFNVIVFGSHARLSRLDRGGVVVTKKFNYKTEPEKLLEFFWRLARLSPAQRGHDVSAVPVVEGSDEYQLMRSRADNPRCDGKNALQEHARKAFKKSLESARWWKLRVDDESDPTGDPEPRYFLIGKPHFAAAKGLVGRATRCYVAIDVRDPQGPFVFLKDAWRVDHEGIRKEGEILGYLNQQAVQNIPTRLCHGDVLPPPYQRTISHEIWSEVNSNTMPCPLKTHRHYRLVVKEVCLPMNDFKNAEELVWLMARCIEAHGNAYKEGILHRDISAGNVLIYINEYVDDKGELIKERDGLLTDWELSKDVEEEPDRKSPRQPDRTGTWQFLSARALAIPTKTIGVKDEMESFFHVLLYYAIRYLPTNCPDITPYMYDYFDGYTVRRSQYTVGWAKRHAMDTGRLVPDDSYNLRFLTSLPGEAGTPPPSLHPINEFIDELLAMLKAQYALYGLESANSGPIRAASPTTTKAPTTGTSQGLYSEKGKAWISSVLANAEDSDDESGPSSQKKEELKRIAAPLTKHSKMVRRFLVPFMLRQEGKPWPSEDKIADQMRADYDPTKEDKKPKLSKPGKGSQAGVSPQVSMPPPSRGSNVSLKRAALHDNDPFEDRSPKRSAIDG
ncbi:hypothetical protein PYCCODRAFT_1460318 [Trametes coccinea BRFM310]|uniref:Fungal-type protein kinase domain-containing protein n=1 Tax=Trametes coccinea (strain BRFM310) TaxID=1353009 RepID=A0A1Y2IGF2_TRAC3|nr:hypothetical protein PYCCODRAFT_1460318 [Trametes coccinea BRFM310]